MARHVVASHKIKGILLVYEVVLLLSLKEVRVLWID